MKLEMSGGPDYGPDRWRPSQATAWEKTEDLEPGNVIVAGRMPFLVDRLEDVTPERWTQDYIDLWLKQEMPDAQTWKSRPIRVHGYWQNPGADTRLHSTVAPARHTWDVLPEHYSVCHKCLELPPCREVHTDTVMRNATAKMARDMAILPGVCHGCREPISKRQKHFTFPGTNLIRPDLGDSTAVFHTRGDCYGYLHGYDKRWAEAEPDRVRFFYCDGTQTQHHDDSLECSNPACTAVGGLKDLVEHKVWVRHHPRMREAKGCWCLAGVLF